MAHSEWVNFFKKKDFQEKFPQKFLTFLRSAPKSSENLACIFNSLALFLEHF
jgi:hypothetical protein